MENGRKLSKKEKKELRKLEWQEKAKIEDRNKKFKKYGVWLGVVIIILLVVGGLIAILNSPATTARQANIAPVSARDIKEGNPKAKVVIIEYADFQCPACGAYHPIISQLLKDYNGKILYVYRMFPLTNLHPNAQISAQAAYAADKQGKFFQYDDYLFNNQNNWADLSDPTSIFISYAKSLGLDLNKFKADMNSAEAKKYVGDSYQEAISEGLNQTPTFILNGNLIQNPASYADFKKLIDAELNQK